ncbi:four-carbon acid sugar kinase family protein [Granulicella arctica]|uniref:four-carbon acid sugar kinase family protein n=1 Tax=Granulicella arctica TaxID=940613 RepID=UPI0021E00EB6|nr:four-carbon acid sugar kinase family protein [Granulicella arctica]
MISCPSFHSVRIIADDLTGACDTAVAFACVGMVTEVETTWSIRTASNAAVIAWNTESREISVMSSNARIDEAASRLEKDPAHHVFKKIDSIFRGNSFSEIAACLVKFPHEIAVLAPAFPELGRTLRDGVLTANDFFGKHHRDIAEGLQNAGVAPHKVSSAACIREAYASGSRVVLCDSETEQDLLAIVGESLNLAGAGRVLWIGSGGLAHALASVLSSAEAPSCPTVTGSTVVFVVGSDHPVTLRQLEHLRLAGANAVVVPIDQEISHAQLRETLAPYADRGVSCLFATGGDTALAVCRALEIDCLRVECEFSRGLPQSRILGGPFKGAHYIMKSGGFGEHDVLSRIAQAFTHARTSERR